MENELTKKSNEGECAKHPLLILFIGCMLVFAVIAIIVALTIVLSWGFRGIVP